jgi:hypothetical protein
LRSLIIFLFQCSIFRCSQNISLISKPRFLFFHLICYLQFSINFKFLFHYLRFIKIMHWILSTTFANVAHSIYGLNSLRWIYGQDVCWASLNKTEQSWPQGNYTYPSATTCHIMFPVQMLCNFRKKLWNIFWCHIPVVCNNQHYIYYYTV